MAKNTGSNYRRGAVDNRSQTYNPKTDQWVKRNAQTGQFMDVKLYGDPFKGVRKEHSSIKGYLQERERLRSL